MTRLRNVRFAALLWGLGTAGAVGVQPAQAPNQGRLQTGLPDEEFDPAVPRSLKTVVVADDPLAQATAPKGSLFRRLPDLARAANDPNTGPAVQQVLRRFAVAHDRIWSGEQAFFRVLPIPVHTSQRFPERFGVVELLPNDTPAPAARTVVFTAIRRIEYFEDMAVAEAARLLDPDPQDHRPTDAAPPGERMAAAELLLSEVWRFHVFAAERGKRRGGGWDAVRNAVADKLTDARLRRLRQAAADRNRPLVKALAERLEELYSKNPKVIKDIYQARLAAAEELLKSSTLPLDLQAARDDVVAYEAKYPKEHSEAVRRIREELTRQAKRLFDEATKASQTDANRARTLLATVEILDPDYPGLRELRGELKGGYSILYVAVRRLPERMSPAAAWYDSEHMAVALLFEGLMAAVPDEASGVRFVPALAADRPRVGTLSREFPLPRTAEAGGPERGAFNAQDVAATLKLLRDKPESWASYGIDGLADEARVEDLWRMRVGLKPGHPDPRFALAVKMLPGRWLVTRGKAADDPEFARRPFGTGPYRLLAATKDEVVFAANPSYGTRPGRLGQPFINEIHFVRSDRLPNLEVALRNERVHVLTDVPTEDLPKYDGASSRLKGVVTAVDRSAANRRITVLAVNHRKPALQSQALRRGIAHAVRRGEILDDVYRKGFPEYHRPLAGPFPPNTWASPRPLGLAPPSLDNKDLAQGKLQEYLKAAGNTTLRLLVPADDPKGRQACERIKRQVEEIGQSDDGKLLVAIEAAPPDVFFRRLHEEFDYDLAYTAFDYPDDYYPYALAAFLDPAAAGRGGRNHLGYLLREANPKGDDLELSRLLQAVRGHADPDAYKPLAQDVYRKFNEAMPFVPLWQLDRHTVFSAKLLPVVDNGTRPVPFKLLDPTTLFAGVGASRLTVSVGSANFHPASNLAADSACAASNSDALRLRRALWLCESGQVAILRPRTARVGPGACR